MDVNVGAWLWNLIATAIEKGYGTLAVVMVVAGYQTWRLFQAEKRVRELAERQQADHAQCETDLANTRKAIGWLYQRALELRGRRTSPPFPTLQTLLEGDVPEPPDYPRSPIVPMKGAEGSRVGDREG